MLRCGLLRALLYSEKGNTVHLYDVDPSKPKSVLQESKETEGLDESLVHIHDDISSLMSGFKAKPRIVIMSLPHGKVIDKVNRASLMGPRIKPSLRWQEHCTDY